MHPEILLQIELVLLVASARKWEASPTNDNQEQLLRSLEQAAQWVERAFSNLVRNRQDGRLRLWASDRGRRVAAVIRRHKEKVLEIPVSQHGSVTASLINGILFLTRKDWVSLLVVEPDPPAKSLAGRFAPRVALSCFALSWSRSVSVQVQVKVNSPGCGQQPGLTARSGGRPARQVAAFRGLPANRYRRDLAGRLVAGRGLAAARWLPPRRSS